MATRLPALCLTIVCLSALPGETALVAQSNPPKLNVHACDLVSGAEVEKVTGRPVTTPPDSLSNVQKTRSDCSYRKAGVWLAVFSAISMARKATEEELVIGGFDMTRQAAAGVGDSAAIYFSKGPPKGLLVVSAGDRVVIVRVRMQEGQPAEAARPRAIELAKIAVAKLRAKGT